MIYKKSFCHLGFFFVLVLSPLIALGDNFSLSIGNPGPSEYYHHWSPAYPPAYYPPPHSPYMSNFNAHVGPIWNQWNARHICPQACANRGGYWEGRWWNRFPGQESVCACRR